MGSGAWLYLNLQKTKSLFSKNYNDTLAKWYLENYAMKTQIFVHFYAVK